jgi:hypothetical protein
MCPSGWFFTLPNFYDARSHELQIRKPVHFIWQLTGEYLQLWKQELITALLDEKVAVVITTADTNKTVSGILLSRLTPHSDSDTVDHQWGFRSNRPPLVIFPASSYIEFNMGVQRDGTSPSGTYYSVSWKYCTIFSLSGVLVKLLWLITLSARMKLTEKSAHANTCIFWYQSVQNGRT